MTAPDATPTPATTPDDATPTAANAMPAQPAPANAAPANTTPAEVSRRTALGAIGAGLGAIAVPAAAATAGATASREAAAAGRTAAPLGVLTAEEAGWNAATGRYELPALPYDYGALEPVIDRQTMEIHHGRHHAGYVRGMNRALDALDAIRRGEGDAGLVKHWSRELSFHASGHINHALFWRVMAPPGAGGGGLPVGRLSEQIGRDFGGLDGFRTHFAAAAKSVEGSGWGWLVWDPIAERLLVIQGEKQQNLMATGVVPILGVDVWEHAYYLQYQNRRAAYVDAFFDVVNWRMVGTMFGRVSGRG